MVDVENVLAIESRRSRDRRSSTALPIDGPNISNIVCGVHLNCRFDLKAVAMHCRNVEYRRRRFPAAIIRILKPKATALVFEAGKMQVLGTKNLEDAKLAARKFARQLQKMGTNPRLENFTVQNIVASADVKFTIRLEGLRLAHWDFTKYEPELFPGLIYSMFKPKMTVLVFAKGKCVFLGAKTTGDLDDAARLIYPVLREHRLL